jgi:hypothetical protein
MQKAFKAVVLCSINVNNIKGAPLTNITGVGLLDSTSLDDEFDGE